MQTPPPYVSWAAFVRVLDALNPRAPDELNAESLRTLANASASAASQMLQALRFLGLVGPKGDVMPELRAMVESPESRRAILPKVLRQSYASLFPSGTTSLSAKDAEDEMTRFGLRQATQRKALTFLLNATAYAGVPVDGRSLSSMALAPAPPERMDPPLTATYKANSMAVELASGGQVQLTVSLDPLRLTKCDRHFVFDLVDRLIAYRDERKEVRRNEDERDAEARTSSTRFVGDQEVPF